MKRISGFTIVELLIVVVVIAILVAISIVAYTNVQTRTRASAVVTELKATKKALQAYKVSSGADDWWIDSDPLLTGVPNPSIQSIINARPDLRNFLQEPPKTTGLSSGSYWAYDNDGDINNGCSADVNGVNLILQGATATEVLQAIDNAVDDGNLSCGKVRVRTADNYFVYGLD